MAVGAGIDFGDGAEFRVGTEDEIHARARPFDFAGLAVASFKGGAVLIGGGPGSPKVQEVDEEVVGERFGLCREDTMLRTAGISVEHTKAADQNGHFGGRQGEQLGLINQHFFSGDGVRTLGVIAETVCLRLQPGEGLYVGLGFAGVRSARCEGYIHAVTRFGSRCFHGGATGQDDEIRHGDGLSAGSGGIERALNALQGVEDFA